jgi:phage terminase small subunit
MLEINLTERGLPFMNARQKKFCDEYLIDCNATQAAIRAGYSPKTAKSIGQENLTKPDLKAYIDEQLELLHNQKTADAQEVLEYLTAVMRGEHTEQTLQLVGEGVQKIADIDVSAKERIKAAELIGKRYGMFKDNVNVDLEPVVIVNDLTE